MEKIYSFSSAIFNIGSFMIDATDPANKRLAFVSESTTDNMRNKFSYVLLTHAPDNVNTYVSSNVPFIGTSHGGCRLYKPGNIPAKVVGI